MPYKRIHKCKRTSIPRRSHLFAFKEDCVAAQSEAYYLALKRLDNERALSLSEDSDIVQTKEHTKIETILLFFKLVFCPKKIKVLPGASVADNFLNMIVTGTMSIAGFLLRAFALLIVAAYIYAFLRINLSV